jgi:hypothetical protein
VCILLALLVTLVVVTTPALDLAALASPMTLDAAVVALALPTRQSPTNIGFSTAAAALGFVDIVIVLAATP